MRSRRHHKKRKKKKEKPDLAENNWKNKQFELLCRIDDICRENGIDMFLSDKTALKAWKEGELFDFISVCIDVRDAKKFIDAVEKTDGLCSRGMYNYGKYPLFDVKVYDPETTDFNLLLYQLFGFANLYVTVKFVKYIPEKGLFPERAVRNRKAYNDYIDIKYGFNVRADHRRLLYYQIIGKIVPAEKLSKHMFEKLLRQFSVDSNIVEISGVRYDKKLLDDMAEAKINGRSFKMPADVKTFFGKKYGTNWRKISLSGYEEDEYRFRDGERPWEEYKERFAYIGLDQYYENRNKWYGINEDNFMNRKLINYTTRVIIRTHFRFLLWKIYFPMKDELKKLQSEGKYKDLEEKLMKYIIVLEKMANKKMTVCFDMEIFDIAVDTLRHTGHEALAEQIVPLVPEEHKEPIRIIDYKGDYI